MKITSNSEDVSGQYLTFTLRDRPYGIPIGKVKEINQLPDITPIPEAPPYVKGVLNLRGKIIPVTDLGDRFGFEEQAHSKETCIIVIETNQGLTGMIVDSVKEVLNFNDDCIEPPPQLGQAKDSNVILGMAKAENQVFILLDTHKIFSQIALQDFASAVEETTAEAE